MFDAGAIIFRIQAMGAEVFKRDLDAADQATDVKKGEFEGVAPQESSFRHES